ncbi:MAG: hypothetical protein ABWK05_02650 [Pyrobaculum sp.]
MLGWVDHFDYYGPIINPAVFKEPKFLVSAIVVKSSEEGYRYALEGWAQFGTLAVVEATAAYVEQYKRGLLDRRRLALKLVELLHKAGEYDVLALQRVLKLGLGLTTCDLGLVALAAVYTAHGVQPQRPLRTIVEVVGEDSVIYIARNNSGQLIYDFETMCVIPMSPSEPYHPLYEAYLKGMKIVTEGEPSPSDLCVAHKKLGVACTRLG